MSVGGVIDVGRVDPLRDAADLPEPLGAGDDPGEDRKSTRLNSSHANSSYAVFCLKKKMELFRHCGTFRVLGVTALHDRQRSMFFRGVKLCEPRRLDTRLQVVATRDTSFLLAWVLD